MNGDAVADNAARRQDPALPLPSTHTYNLPSAIEIDPIMLGENKAEQLAHIRELQQREALAMGSSLDHYRISDNTMLFQLSQKSNRASAWVGNSEITWEILTDGSATATSTQLGEYRRRYGTMMSGHYGTSLDWKSLTNNHNNVSKLSPSRSGDTTQGTEVSSSSSSRHRVGRRASPTVVQLE